MFSYVELAVSNGATGENLTLSSELEIPLKAIAICQALDLFRADRYKQEFQQDQGVYWDSTDGYDLFPVKMQPPAEMRNVVGHYFLTVDRNHLVGLKPTS